MFADEFLQESLDRLINNSLETKLFVKSYNNYMTSRRASVGLTIFSWQERLYTVCLTVHDSHRCQSMHIMVCKEVYTVCKVNLSRGT